MIENNIEKTISCDGTDNSAKGNVSKHPLVYFKVSTDKKIECPYCGRDFTSHSLKNK
jgi:uncharacterized Zn-finger protein